MARPARKPKRAQKPKKAATPKKAQKPRKAAPKRQTPAKRPRRDASKRPTIQNLPPARKAVRQVRKKGPKLPPVRELRKLAKRPWSSLSAKQQGLLRTWRGRRGAKTRREQYYVDLVERLNSPDPRVQRGARRELREEGTRGVADYLHDEGWEDDDISDVIAFWFYSQ